MQRALDSLDQMESRLGAHYSARRRHDRITFRGLATLFFPEGENDPPDAASDRACTVHARSLSQSGLSFLHPGEIREKCVTVGLDLGNAATTWFLAEIVRCKQILDEGFWEYGVRFLRRADSPPRDSALADAGRT